MKTLIAVFAVVIAAGGTAPGATFQPASLFFTAFGGSWSCAAHAPAAKTARERIFRTPWIVARAPGGDWTTVRWNGNRGGIAYVAYVRALKMWLYDDYHYDGSFYRDFSTGPDAKGIWRWYDSHDQLHADPNGGPIEWQRVSATSFRQTYWSKENGKRVYHGYSLCTAVR